MRTLSAFLLVLVVLSLSSPAAAGNRGVGLAAGAFDGEFMFQLRKDFKLGGDISQISGQAGMWFPGKTSFRLDVDYHFVIKSGKSRFYPLAGIDFSFNSDRAKFGVNAGGGFKFMLTDSLRAFAEVKYVFGDWDGWGFLGGVYF